MIFFGLLFFRIALRQRDDNVDANALDGDDNFDRLVAVAGYLDHVLTILVGHGESVAQAERDRGARSDCRSARPLLAPHIPHVTP